MASGRAHKSVSTKMAIPLAVASGIVTGDPVIAFTTGAGALFSVVCSPDLDIRQITISERTMIQKLGPIGWGWYLFWLPYAYMIPHHRHWLSHSVWGTFLRVLYLHAPLLPLAAFYPEWSASLLALSFSASGIGFWLGLLAGDLAHLAMDSVKWGRPAEKTKQGRKFMLLFALLGLSRGRRIKAVRALVRLLEALKK